MSERIQLQIKFNDLFIASLWFMISALQVETKQEI